MALISQHFHCLSELTMIYSYSCDFSSWVTGLTAWGLISWIPTLWSPSVRWLYLAWRGEVWRWIWFRTVELLLLTPLCHTTICGHLCVSLSFQLSPHPHRNFLCRCWLEICELFSVLRQYKCLVWKERAWEWVDYLKYLPWCTVRSEMSQMLSSKVNYLIAGNSLKWCGPFLKPVV